MVQPGINQALREAGGAAPARWPTANRVFRGGADLGAEGYVPPVAGETITDTDLDGLISVEEACETWDLSAEELDGWLTAVSSHGINALRTTALQRYRSTRS